MPIQNSANEPFINNADGWTQLGGTTQRGLTLSGNNLNIALSTLSIGDTLTFNGTNFVNAPAGASLTLDGLSDVVITSASASNILLFNGTNWVNGFSSTQTSTDTSTTTSTTYQNKIQYTTPTLPSGTYRISWYYVYSYSSASRSLLGRITVGGSPITSFRSPAAGGTIANQIHAGYYELSLSGVQTIALQYASTNSGDTCTVWGAHLTVTRVT